MTIPRVLLLDPGIGSLNLGDEVISEGVRTGISDVLESAHCVTLSTHQPLGAYGQFLGSFDLTVVGGSNLLRGRMNRRFRQWDLRPRDAAHLKDAVLMGVGWWQYGDRLNGFTRRLYQRVLSSVATHSVRDSYTEKQLVDGGFKNVLNTGCPTLWDLTPEHCANLPAARASRVVFTLTDYAPSAEEDAAMVRLLKRSYDRVLFWPQGSRDLEYLVGLGVSEDVEVVHPNLASFDAVLLHGDIDHVGTRLHGGVRALQKGRRSLILAVDNRARELRRDFGIPCVDRGSIDRINSWVRASPPVEIGMPWQAINEWKSQPALAELRAC